MVETIDLDLVTNESSNSSFTGGNQESLLGNESYLNDDNIYEIVHRYFPDEKINASNLEIVFKRISFVGCGYVAQLNTLFDNYANNPEKILKIFNIDKNSVLTENGEIDFGKVSDYALLDYALYTSKKNGGESLAQVEKTLNPTKSNAQGEVSTATNYQTYLNEKGIEITTHNITKDIQKEMLTHPLDASSNVCNYIKSILETGQKITFNKYVTFTLETEDKDQDEHNKIYTQLGVIDFPFKDTDPEFDSMKLIGGHSMSILGVTNDNKLIVSSWGKIFHMDPCLVPVDITTAYVAYDYKN